MAYTIEIPQELHPEIIEAVQTIKRKFNVPIMPMNFLMRVYYRYVEELGKFKSLEEKIDFKFSCNACRVQVLEFFEKQIKLQGWTA